MSALSFGGDGTGDRGVRERVAAAGLSLSEFEQHAHARGRDAVALVSFLQHVSADVLSLFCSEHFLWHTKQSGRPLSDLDMRMLLWLKKVYCGEERAVADGRPQQLPYPLGFQFFFAHLFGAK